jgi:hypothetical protein
MALVRLPLADSARAGRQPYLFRCTAPGRAACDRTGGGISRRLFRSAMSQESGWRRRICMRGNDKEEVVVVIGAGLAGLTAAATAARARRPVVVVEAHTSGGRARTDELSGYRFKQGRVLPAAAVVIAAGSPAVARKLMPVDPGWPELGPPVIGACPDLGLRGPHPSAVIGVDEPLYLACHCPPGDLEPAGGSVVHVMRYGARDAGLDRAEPDPRLAHRAARSVRRPGPRHLPALQKNAVAAGGSARSDNACDADMRRRSHSLVRGAPGRRRTGADR